MPPLNHRGALTSALHRKMLVSWPFPSAGQQRMALHTRLTELFNIEHPIISAPMAFAAGGNLAAAITNAGGLGLIGGGYGDAEWLEREFSEARNARVGCGFITWSLAKCPELLDLALTYSPAAVMLSFGSPIPFAARVKAAGARLICQIQNMEHAREAVAANADVIVAQGAEAGGHGMFRATLTLVPEIADYLIKAAPETVLDVARKIEWPKPFTARVMKTRFVEDWHGREADLAKPEIADREMHRYVTAMQKADPDNTGVWVGEATGLIRDVRPAGELLQEIVGDAEGLLGDKAPSFIRMA